MTSPRARRLRAALVAVLTLALAGLLAACGETKSDQGGGGAGGGGGGGSSSTQAAAKANPDAPLKKGLKIVSMPKQLGNPYEEVEHSGVEEAVKELGGSYRLVGPTDASASSQVPLINSIAQQRPDALIIAANDPNAVVPALKQAAARGVNIVTMDSDADPSARPVFINQASSEQIGRVQVQMMCQQIGCKGQIAILSATANATNQNTWIRYMKDELRKPRYAQMKLVKIAYGDDDDQKSFQQTQGLLQAYPNLKGIIAPTSVGIAAAARYLSSSPAKGKVKLTGLGTPNQMRKFVKNGTVTEFALWNPKDVGYLAAWAAASLASGQITGAPGQSFKAGKLGSRTIGQQGQVILGPPTKFNAKNIDEYNF
jgi:rhamnose transport system substrate-binding protein